jgi:hypothetical protein
MVSLVKRNNESYPWLQSIKHTVNDFAAFHRCPLFQVAPKRRDWIDYRRTD